MPAAYPTSIITLASHSDTTDTIFASDVNTPNAEIVAIETGLLNGFQHNVFPLTDNAKDLGDATHAWKNIWSKGTVQLNGITYTFPAADGSNNQVLGTNGSKVLSWVSPFSVVASAQNAPAVTNFETAARFSTGSQINGGGNNIFTTTGLQLLTSATGTSSTGVKWTLGETNENLIANSPRVSGRLGLTTKGTDAQVFFGLGVITVSGTTLTMTDSHVGFKITWAGSGVASLFATQSDGTETASGALTTVVAGDALELMIQVNGSTSADYYWRKNGGAWSAATNLATHVPTSITSQIQAAICNSAVASASTVTMASASYTR